MRRFVVVKVVKVVRTKDGEARVRERIAANKCVSCETTTEKANVPDGSKQQCEKCRSRHRRLIALLPESKQQKFIDKLIEAGRALMPHELSLIKPDDQTQKIFAEVSK